jgi:predicted metal-dependent phosphoesterase TrpH
LSTADDARDVHVLGYFFDPEDEKFNQFLRTQRLARVERVYEIARRLASLGFAIDVEALLRAVPGDSGRSVGRPAVADALVAAGHAADRRDAFDRLLGSGRPAFVPRRGPDVAEVVATIAAAGGIASLAHPGLMGLDECIPGYAAAGLSAIEVRHREHNEEDEARYRALAQQLGLGVSGGSDFHGEYDARDGSTCVPGDVTLAPSDFALLEARRPLVPSPRAGARKANPSA